jgi:hypothetical protein
LAPVCPAGAEAVQDLPSCATQARQKGGNFWPGGKRSRNPHRRKNLQKMAGQGALLVPANFWARSSRDFLSGFAVQSDKNVSRETFWYDW